VNITKRKKKDHKWRMKNNDRDKVWRRRKKKSKKKIRHPILLDSSTTF
jgi:hypothetical protein